MPIILFTWTIIELSYLRPSLVFLSTFLPSFLPSLLSSFIPSVLPTFLLSFLLSVRPSFFVLFWTSYTISTFCLGLWLYSLEPSSCYSLCCLSYSPKNHFLSRPFVTSTFNYISVYSNPTPFFFSP